MSKYIPSFSVARMLGLNGLALSKITSSFSVIVDDQRQNLGLNLKFEAKKLKVLGYSRKSESGWEFSNKAINLIKEYMQKFPEFFRGIQAKPTADIYNDTDFYPPEISKSKIKEIQSWLKEIESKSFEKVPLESQQLDGDVAKMIETAANQYNETAPNGEFKRIKAVPRKALLKPSDAEHRLQDQRFTLGDRIVYVQDSGKVPIATKGTVIGITKTTRVLLLDVIFDVSFMSGSTLGDRCSPFRGMTIPFSSALNLSTRQLIAQNKASTTVKHDVTTIHGNGLHAAPPPRALQNSFSGALRGTHSARGVNGRGTNSSKGRGRGGAISSGASSNPPQAQQIPPAPKILKRNPPSSDRAGHLNGSVGHIRLRGTGQQQYSGNTSSSYSAVPPPPILNSASRGAGRGGSRATRGRGRGRGGVTGTNGGTTTTQVAVSGD